jgi:hypothetical protein
MTSRIVIQFTSPWKTLSLFVYPSPSPSQSYIYPSLLFIRRKGTVSKWDRVSKMRNDVLMKFLSNVTLSDSSSRMTGEGKGIRATEIRTRGTL